MQPARLKKLHKCGGGTVGRIKLPPELNLKHHFVEPPRPPLCAR